MSAQSAKDLLSICFAIVGALVLAAFGVTESLVKLGVSLGTHDCDRGFPWGQVIVGIVLVIPFTLGTEAAKALAQGVANRLGGGN